jgi:UDPglucose--hexose-1-phosphate uridylyltransferase
MRCHPTCRTATSAPATRESAARNPDYVGVYVFDNDHPCVGPDAPMVGAAHASPPPPAPYQVRRANGLARVICYSPRHDLTVAAMSVGEIAAIVQTWQQQTRDLGGRPEVNQVLIFENKGEVVGVSNPHPHGQIYATNFTWKTFDTELHAMRRYQSETGGSLFADIIAAEQADGRRILYEDEHTIAFVPYFARYAYEVYVAPKRSVPHFTALDDAEVESLARALKDVTVRYDNLWRQSFPYVMPLHQAPTDGGDNFLSDTAPEDKAAELRAQPTIHYRQQKFDINHEGHEGRKLNPSCSL